MSDPYLVTLSVTLTAEQALALAQFCKRVGFDDIRRNAVDSAEHELMGDALDLVQRELAEKGYAPR